MVPPAECPHCGFVWGEYQGTRHEYGYLMLASRVFKCTRCRTIVANPEPNFRSVI